jgi:hypothetical protein
MFLDVTVVAGLQIQMLRRLEARRPLPPHRSRPQVTRTANARRTQAREAGVVIAATIELDRVETEAYRTDRLGGSI